MKLLLLIGFGLLLSACASTPLQPAPGWQAVTLPGKSVTQYSVSHKEGRAAIQAKSQRSASLWRRTFSETIPAPSRVSFSWWVDDVVPGANVADAEREDAPARVLLAFDGDHSTLPARDRMLFDLAQALTGERPPFATLMYVYGSEQAVGSLVHNPRTDRVRKIVLDSGAGPLRRWRDHQRDLVADFKLAFGEAPGRLMSVALMTDTDNTGTRALTWYGPVVLD